MDKSNGRKIENEVYLSSLWKIIKLYKSFILGFSGLTLILSVVYVTSASPVYRASTIVTPPDELSVFMLNNMSDNDKAQYTAESIYLKFLEKLTSERFRHKVLKNNSLKDGSFVDSYHNIKIKKTSSHSSAEVSLTGDSPEEITSLLNNFVRAADQDVVRDLVGLEKIKLQTKLEYKQRLYDKEISVRKAKLIEKQMAEIEALEQRIVSLESNRIKDLKIMREALEVARLNKGLDKIHFAVGLREGYKAIEWSRYGELALLKAVENLQQAENGQTAYHYETKRLRKMVQNAKHNLEALESNRSSGGVGPNSEVLFEINLIKSRILYLEGVGVDSTALHAMKVDKVAETSNNPIAPKKKRIVVLTSIAGFIVSILLAFLMSSFRRI